MLNLSPPQILLVTRNFPPLVGGMEKLNFHIYQALTKKFVVALSGPQGSKAFHNLDMYAEFPFKPLWKYILVSFFKTIWLALKVKPSVVFSGSGAAILASFFAAKLTSAKLICYLHGLDIIAANPIYQCLFVPLIKQSDCVVVNSNHTRLLAIKAGVAQEKIILLPPGAEMPDLNKREYLIKSFSDAYEFGTKPFLLIVGRITKRKGIIEFIQHVMPALINEHPELVLIIIGDEATQAMQVTKGVKYDIQQAISDLNLTNNVKLIGSVSDEMLSAAFFSSELLVFPVLNLPNDVEGFGMVAIEAAAHGLPTLGFSVGGVPDAIGEGTSGWLIESGNYQAMLHVIRLRLNKTLEPQVTKESCQEFSHYFAWPNFEKKLANLIETVVETTN